MSPRTPFAAFAAVLLAVTLTAGCSGSEDLGPLGDPAAAQQRIDSLIDGTLKAITPAVPPRQDWWYRYREERNGINNNTGYTEVERQSYLEERIAEGKQRVLLGQAEKYWSDQGCTVGAEKSDSLRVYVSATCADKAVAVVEIGKDGVALVKALVEKTKLGSGPSPFPNTLSPRPTASETPVGKRDHPYWSH
ncbi:MULTISPECIES: hypothetical protein [Kitasatospora]|uniref:Lipoprotein n=1 Tax=Kitasatospora setae (strain ATCC 33774 / DSM 43861 / JCM 3304 / KCC A-0304 / NBRC 14216 / KM-6054) TaxID=452652 RepID=E4NF34_KITSK|nr:MULTISPECIES: hypothetical protein [Kitasatospora]BAJ30114.1 hypothetical protein KSE_43300 [Kitasatospora setae KM-6054]